MAFEKEGSNRANGVLTFLGRELRKFLGIFAYLFVLFGFYALCRAVIEGKNGVDLAMHGFAAINAAIFGKVILVGEQLRFGQWLRRGPLVYPILLESLLFTLLLLVFHFLEHAAVAFFRGESTITINAEGGWLRLACVAILMFIGLIPFFAYRNLARAIGAQRLHALLFGGSEQE